MSPMRSIKPRIARLRRAASDALYEFSNRFSLGLETRKSRLFYRGQNDWEDYHRSETGWQRSRWIAEEVLPGKGVASLLEIGANSGRNLSRIRALHPGMRLKGTDINPGAVEYARTQCPGILFEVSDVTQPRWSEPERGWDAVLIVSVLSAIPGESIERVCANIAKTAGKLIIAVEFWDGSEGRREFYKHSHDLKRLFERQGVKTERWQLSPIQHNIERSPMWEYVGSL